MIHLGLSGVCKEGKFRVLYPNLVGPAWSEVRRSSQGLLSHTGQEAFSTSSVEASACVVPGFCQWKEEFSKKFMQPPLNTLPSDAVLQVPRRLCL